MIISSDDPVPGHSVGEGWRWRLQARKSNNILNTVVYLLVRINRDQRSWVYITLNKTINKW